MELRDVKPVMAQGLTVIWQNMPYTVSGCTIKYDRKARSTASWSYRWKTWRLNHSIHRNRPYLTCDVISERGHEIIL